MIEKLGKYEITGEIGDGGFGKVYRARDSSVGRDVAIKVIRHSLPASLVARFRADAAALAKLRHQNIVTIYDFGEDGGYPYIVTELIEGKDLGTLIREGVQLSVRRRVRILMQIARALHHAHKQNLIHRCVKPANVILRADGEVKILDFGIAQTRDESAGHSGAGYPIGALKHMAPEQLAGGAASPLTDQFGVGVLAYQLLTGRHPFLTSSEPALMYSIVNEPFAPLENVRPPLPAKLCQAVGRLLAKNPADRYPDLSVFEADLREAFAELLGSLNPDAPTAERTMPLPPPAPDPEPAPATAPVTSRSLALAIAALAICAAGLAAWIFWPKAEAPAGQTQVAAMSALPAPTVTQPRDTLTNSDVVAMVQANLPEKDVIANIRSAKSAFDLSATGIIALNDAKVPPAIIAAMRKDDTNAVASEPPVRSSRSSTMIWNGTLPAGVFLEITGATPTMGAIASGLPFPSTAHKVKVEPKGITIFEPPSARNGWQRLAVRNDRSKPVTQIRITWETP
jgi:serine/threonine protein kinase